MIDTINEGSVRVSTKVDHAGTIHEKEASLQKAEQLRETRPVEKTETGNQAEGRLNEKEDSKFLVDDKHLIFEKYDKNGDLVLRIPPSYKPVDQRA